MTRVAEPEVDAVVEPGAEADPEVEGEALARQSRGCGDEQRRRSEGAGSVE
ncbi:hypothetical protein [Gaopeijia maritima]|uniref:Uncharacterized protein n=1 Tax=Gaopeijia maritima TaxID=3119007 RepID=A0ABU9E6P9_9BACT